MPDARGGAKGEGLASQVSPNASFDLSASLSLDSTRISTNEKEELIGSSPIEQTRGLGKFNLLVALLLLLLILSVFVPKIYISNNIYYLSRDLARLQAERDLLREEQLRAYRSIENIKNRHLLMELGY